MRISKLLFSLVCLSASCSIFAQEKPNVEEIETIAPDRPGYGDAISIVPAKNFQVETGFQYDADKSNSNTGVQNYTWNTTLLRLGISEHIEARLDWNVVQTKTSLNGTQIDKQTGVLPFRLGMKAKISDNKGAIPAVTFIGMMGLPFTASKNMRPSYVNTDLQLSCANSITDWLTLCYNLGLSFDGNQPNPTGYYALSLEFGIGDKLGAYVQGRGFSQRTLNINNSYDFDNSNAVEAGVMFYPKPHIQIDLSGGLTVVNANHGGTPAFVTAGLSWRFPK